MRSEPAGEPRLENFYRATQIISHLRYSIDLLACFLSIANTLFLKVPKPDSEGSSSRCGFCLLVPYGLWGLVHYGLLSGRNSIRPPDRAGRVNDAGYGGGEGYQDRAIRAKAPEWLK